MDIWMYGHILTVEGENEEGESVKIEEYVNNRQSVGDDLLEVVNELHNTTYVEGDTQPETAMEHFDSFKFNATEDELREAYEELKSHVISRKLEHL
jgi:hypothetical protein